MVLWNFVDVLPRPPCAITLRSARSEVGQFEVYYFLFLFFRVQSALCLGSLLAKLANRCEKEVNFFSAALWAFAFRPLLGVR